MAILPPLIKPAFLSTVPDLRSPNKISRDRWNAPFDVFLGTVLNALIALPVSADKMVYWTNEGSASLATITGFGRSLAGLNDAAAARALIGALNSAGDAMTGALAMGGNRITGLGAPSASGDATTKAYVDALTTGAALFQDGWDASSGAFPNGSAKKGWWWLCTTAGTVDGQPFSVGDSVYARVDNPGTGTYAAKWQILQGSLTLAEIQSAIGFTFGTLAQLSSVTASLISDASANGRSLITASNYAAMKTLLAIGVADITDASANGRSLISAANYAAMKGLLAITNSDVSGLGAAALLGIGAGLSSSGGNIVAAVQSVASLTGAITASGLKTALAIAESDVSGLVADLAAKAALASPTFTGTPAAPTAVAGTNTTQLATTAFVQAAITALIGGAPGALDTLKELADAINDDASYAATMTTALAAKAPLASPVFTGTPKAPTQSALDNSTNLATTAYVDSAVTAAVGGSSGFTTGDVKMTLKTTADSGWIMLDDGTIGDASSSASTRANADTSALFALLWNNFANTEAAVSSGRGASAAADFAAHKTIALPKALGRALGIAGAGSGLTSRAMGKTVGEETHTPTLAEMYSHTHSVNNQNNLGVNPIPGGCSGAAAGTNSGNTGSAGSSSPHNVMQPTTFIKAMVKL